VTAPAPRPIVTPPALRPVPRGVPPKPTAPSVRMTPPPPPVPAPVAVPAAVAVPAPTPTPTPVPSPPAATTDRGDTLSVDDLRELLRTSVNDAARSAPGSVVSQDDIDSLFGGVG